MKENIKDLCKELNLDIEDAKELKELLDLSLKELYAIHYIYSRMLLCSWHVIPTKYSIYYPGWIKCYRSIKDKLTDEIINAICESGVIGTDLIEIGKKGYNLCKIFNYTSLDGEYKEYPPYYEVPEKQLRMFTPFDYVCLNYEKSIIPLLCGGGNNG